MTRTARILAAAGVAFAVATAAFFALRAPVPENFRQARIALPDVELRDARARAFRLHDDLPDDALVIVNFSYTTCESICPLGNQIMQFVDERRDEIARPVALISITIDPGRDTPDRMRAAAEAFGASRDWHWLTGSPAAIDAVLRSAGANVADIRFHDPVFLVGEIGSGRFFRSLSMPDADELIGMLGRFGA